MTSGITRDGRYRWYWYWRLAFRTDTWRERVAYFIAPWLDPDHPDY